MPELQMTESRNASRLSSAFKVMFKSRKVEETPRPRPRSGDIIQLDGLRGSFELTDGEPASLQDLVDISVGGVILFTCPKASTAQASLFRDSYQHLRGFGFAIYGLSQDSPQANTQFNLKNNLPFSLICNTDGVLIDALGFKRLPHGTVRGVIVIDKDGKVLVSMVGTPDATVRAVYDVCEALEAPRNEAQKLDATALAMNNMGAKLDGRDKQMLAEAVATVAGQVNAIAQDLEREAVLVPP